LIKTLSNRNEVGARFCRRTISAIASAQAADVTIVDFYGRWVSAGIAPTETGNVR
jgi:hypothetical protein